MKKQFVLPIVLIALGTTACSPTRSVNEQVKDKTTVFVDDAVIPTKTITIDDGIDEEDKKKSEANPIPTYESEDDIHNDEEPSDETSEETILQQNGDTVSKKRGNSRSSNRRSSAPAIDRSRITVGSITGSSKTTGQNQARKFAPASITKLITTGMAFEKLGADFTFRHYFKYKMAQGSTTAIAGLTWVNEGDPTIGHRRFETDAQHLGQLKRMAAELKRRGITSIRGPVVLQASEERARNWFVAPGIPDWEPFTCYGAPPRAFNFNQNCSGPKSGYRQTEPVAKAALLSALRATGITVNETAAAAPQGQLQSVMFRTAPLDRLVRHMNKPSDNLIAESLFRAVAATKPGPLQANGQHMYRDSMISWLTQMGAGNLDGELLFLDGSGLSPNSSTTPRAFMTVLKRFIDRNYFDALWASLPVAGVDGTMANRAKNPQIMGKVRAKTGTLTGFYQLAGYIPRLAADGKTVRELVPFVILTAAPGNDTYRRAAKAYQDEILVGLSRQINAR